MNKKGKRGSHIPAMATWAVRELIRSGGRTVLLFVALATLVCVVATPLLLTQTLTASSEMLLADGPSLVIRRVTAGGWATIPVVESLKRIQSIPGVLRVGKRVWGLARVNGRTLTLVGVEPTSGETGLQILAGEAVAGVGAGLSVGQGLDFGSGETLGIKVVKVLAADSSLVAYDVLLLHIDDAREILGIPQGEASDLVVDVFHKSEESAIIADLATALPWSVQITTRGETLGIYNASLSKRGGIGILLILPALLALLLLVVTMLRQGFDARKEMGILKAMGWTSRDIARLHLWKSILLGAPAVVLGASLAYAMIFTPAVSWIAALFFGWQGRAPYFIFSSAGSLSLLVLVCCLVFFPFLAAVLGPVLFSSTTDPVELVRKN